MLGPSSALVGSWSSSEFLEERITPGIGGSYRENINIISPRMVRNVTVYQENLGVIGGRLNRCSFSMPFKKTICRGRIQV